MPATFLTRPTMSALVAATNLPQPLIRVQAKYKITEGLTLTVLHGPITTIPYTRIL